MKKFFVAFGAALLMVGTFSSCNKGASNANVSAEDKALGDSAATIIGQFAGARSASDYQRLKEMQPEMAEKFSKEAFLKGLKQVLDADTAQMAYYQGLQMGLQLVNPIIGINQEAGVPLSKDAVYAAFKKVYEQDSVADMSTYYEQYQDIMNFRSAPSSVATRLSPTLRRLKTISPPARLMPPRWSRKAIPRLRAVWFTKSRTPAPSPKWFPPTR